MKFLLSAAQPAQLESGLIQVLRVVVVAVLILQPLTRRGFGIWLGASAPLPVYFLLTLPLQLLIIALVWTPWFAHNLGRAFLPLVLALASFAIIFDKFVTLNWFIAPDARELIAQGFLLSAWFTLQMVTFFVAWQYNMGAVMFTGITLTLLDSALTLPFINPSGSLYPFFISLVVARLSIVTGVSLGIAWLMLRQRAQRAQLQSANEKLAFAATTGEQLAVSRERNRMARELHDTLAHSLSAVSVQLEAVSALWDDEPHEARKILEQATRSARNGLTEARRALHELRASPLDDLGLPLALRALAESAAARAGLRLELTLPSSADGLQPQVEQCIYRVAQEALENVIRHARARHVAVTFEQRAQQFTLRVTDDGIGFEPARVNTRAIISGHYGLRGMRERAAMVGCRLSVRSAPQRGVCVIMENGLEGHGV
ncbi:MAG: hypothetical protein B6D41_19485 [Chloroflexi bacterium UTCFX4]|jgi:signal transduction histidine kinase|nr:MAG: hypothetical protein B6D41_19485 [Chloroflexi bacterium UTCFX4]